MIFISQKRHLTTVSKNNFAKNAVTGVTAFFMHTRADRNYAAKVVRVQRSEQRKSFLLDCTWVSIGKLFAEIWNLDREWRENHPLLDCTGMQKENMH